MELPHNYPAMSPIAPGMQGAPAPRAAPQQAPGINMQPTEISKGHKVEIGAPKGSVIFVKFPLLKDPGQAPANMNFTIQREAGQMKVSKLFNDVLINQNMADKTLDLNSVNSELINTLANMHALQKTKPKKVQEPFMKDLINEQIKLKQELSKEAANRAKIMTAFKYPNSPLATIPLMETAKMTSEVVMNSPLKEGDSYGADIFRYFSSNVIEMQDDKGNDLMKYIIYPPIPQNATEIQKNEIRAEARFNHLLVKLMEHQGISEADQEAIFALKDQHFAKKPVLQDQYQAFFNELATSPPCNKEAANRVINGLRGLLQSYINTPSQSIMKSASGIEETSHTGVKTPDGSKMRLNTDVDHKSVIITFGANKSISFEHRATFFEKQQPSRYEVKMSNKLTLNPATKLWESNISVSVGTPVVKNKKGETEVDATNAKAIYELKKTLAHNGFDVQIHLKS